MPFKILLCPFFTSLPPKTYHLPKADPRWPYCCLNLALSLHLQLEIRFKKLFRLSFALFRRLVFWYLFLGALSNSAGIAVAAASTPFKGAVGVWGLKGAVKLSQMAERALVERQGILMLTGKLHTALKEKAGWDLSEGILQYTTEP